MTEGLFSQLGCQFQGWPTNGVYEINNHQTCKYSDRGRIDSIGYRRKECGVETPKKDFDKLSFYISNWLGIKS